MMNTLTRNPLTSNLSRLEVLLTYVLNGIRWGLFGAFAGWAIPTIAFLVAAHDGGFHYPLFAWHGFLTLTTCFGAFVGAGTSIEGSDHALWERHRAVGAAKAKHPSN